MKAIVRALVTVGLVTLSSVFLVKGLSVQSPEVLTGVFTGIFIGVLVMLMAISIFMEFVDDD